MTAPHRLLVARLWHEGNSFSPAATTRDDFERAEWLAGEEARRFHLGGSGELAAAVAFAEAAGDCDVRFSRCAAAAPGGPLAAGVFGAVRDEIVADVLAFRPDAVYLSLHGALLAQDADDADVALLRAVREAAGDAAVIGVSLDMHANAHPDLAALAQVVCGYATYPHVDMRETGAKVVGLVAAALRGQARPRSAIAPLGRVLPSHAMRTTRDAGGNGPMGDVQARLRAWEEAHPGRLALSALGGFAYADVPHAGASGLACVDLMHVGEADAPKRWAARVRDALAQEVARFYPVLPGVAQGLALACEAIEAGRRPVAVIDPADNPLSGGVADTTTLLRALVDGPLRDGPLREELPGGGPSQRDTVFAFFHDPALVARAAQAGVGAVLDVSLGGRLLPAFGAPVAMCLRVARRTDGRFVNEGPMWAGQPCDVGESVVLEDPVRALRVVVTSRCEAPNDPAWFALHGIEFDTVALLCVKAKNHFRAAMGARMACIIEVDAPGLACLDLAALPFRRVPAERLRAP
jgi:microcystin degradation protein MlrC